jgi:predicted cation transporter
MNTIRILLSFSQYILTTLTLFLMLIFVLPFLAQHIQEFSNSLFLNLYVYNFEPFLIFSSLLLAFPFVRVLYKKNIKSSRHLIKMGLHFSIVFFLGLVFYFNHYELFYLVDRLTYE